MLKNVQNLLPNFGCLSCGDGFVKESVNIVRGENGLLVLKIKCVSCERNFGMALLGLEMDELTRALDVQKTPAINYDDVLDAHQYFKDADLNWGKFIAGK
jgi:hypothetical protein